MKAPPDSFRLTLANFVIFAIAVFCGIGLFTTAFMLAALLWASLR